MDVSALVLDGGGRVLSDQHFVFYNNPDSGDGAVLLRDEAPEAEHGGAREVGIAVDLSALAPRAGSVLFALSIHDAEARGQDLSMVRALHLRLFDAQGGPELLCYGFPRGPAHSTGLTLGELVREEDGWAFQAVSRGYAGGLAEIAESHGVDVRGDADADADVDAAAT